MIPLAGQALERWLRAGFCGSQGMDLHPGELLGWVEQSVNIQRRDPVVDKLEVVLEHL